MTRAIGLSTKSAAGRVITDYLYGRKQDQAHRPAAAEQTNLLDVDSLHADLQRRGAMIQSPPRMAPYGIREMVVEDLNGYRLAFGEIQL